MTNLSRSKGNRGIKFGQFIEYNIRNIFSWKTKRKMWLRNYFNTFFKKIKIEHISWSIIWSVIQFVFVTWQVDDYQNILKLNCIHFHFTSYKAFFKNEERSGTSVPAIFSACFVKKFYFYCYIVIFSITWSNFIVLLSLLFEILRNMCIANVC